MRVVYGVCVLGPVLDGESIPQLEVIVGPLSPHLYLGKTSSNHYVRSCLFGVFVAAIIAMLSVVFIHHMRTSRWRIAGILEWTLSYGGAVYIWTFVGFVAVPEEGTDQRERVPLLGEPAYLSAVENDVDRRTENHAAGRGI